MELSPYDKRTIPASVLLALDDDPFWEPRDRRDANNANSFEQILDIALRIAVRMPKPLTAVCGPITSGGTGSVTGNFLRFAETIKSLRGQGWNVFNQLTFERYLWYVVLLPGRREMDIMDVFYDGLFRSEQLTQLAFMPDWQTSNGARLEHRMAIELRIPIVYLCP